MRVYAVRPFQPDDILLLSLREEERKAWAGYDLCAIAASKQGTLARTFLVDDMPLVVYGLLTPWPTLGALWSWFSTGAGVHRWALWKHLRWEWQALLEEAPALRRVETWTLWGDTLAVRVVEHLGFRICAVKPQFGPQGATYTEWVWYPPQGETDG